MCAGGIALDFAFFRALPCSDTPNFFHQNRDLSILGLKSVDGGVLPNPLFRPLLEVLVERPGRSLAQPRPLWGEPTALEEAG
jgi:hypothetical protein